MPPQVSVLVPVYNGAQHIGATLQHLLAQTIREIEVLVVDDGSTDNTAAVVAGLSDPRVRLIRKEHSGLVRTLNRGIAEAGAPLLARNDHDDLSLPHRLEREVAAMRAHPDAVAVFSFTTKLGGKRQWANTDKLSTTSRETRPLDSLSDGCLMPSTMLARTDVLRQIGGFREAFYPADDWDMQLRLEETGDVLVVQESLVTYRFHAGASTYRNFDRMELYGRWARDCHMRRLRGEPELSADAFAASEPGDVLSRFHRARRGKARFYMRYAGQSYLDGHYAAAAGRLSLAVLLHPRDLFQRIGRMLRRPQRLAS